MLGLAGPSGTGVGRRPEADSCWPADQGDGAQSYGRGPFERDEIAARAIEKDDEIDEVDEPFRVTQGESSDSGNSTENEDKLGNTGRS